MPILTAEERIGTTIAGKYQLESILGRGGMGVVYRAMHAWTNRPVAVKVLSASIEDPALQARFLQEARTATALRHPNVVEVLDMGRDHDGTCYLVLELLEGEPLSTLLRRGRLSLESALQLLLPVLDALAVAHDKGIVHRDLKPDNVFLHQDRGEVVPKLLDFGIAKAFQEGAGKLTQTGMVVGTPHYLSPEQATAKVVGPASDVWAMGVVLHETLSGRVPFEGDSPTAIVVQIVTTAAPSLALHLPSAHPAIVAVVDRTLQQDLTQRYPHARALGEALIRAGRTAGVASTPPKDLARGLGEATGSIPIQIAPHNLAPSAPATTTPLAWSGQTRAAPASSSKLLLIAGAAVAVLLLGGIGIGGAVALSGMTDLVPSARPLPLAAPRATGATLPPIPQPALRATPQTELPPSPVPALQQPAAPPPPAPVAAVAQPPAAEPVAPAPDPAEPEPTRQGRHSHSHSRHAGGEAQPLVPPGSQPRSGTPRFSTQW